MTGLDSWIDLCQDDPGGPDGGDWDGGSWYAPGDNWAWVNILKTGNLLHQMAFVDGPIVTPRVTDAINYLVRHWGDPDDDPGWKGSADPLAPGAPPASYQATFTVMKGLESFGIDTIDGINWFDELADVLIAQQNALDGSWPPCLWGDGDRILSTSWALLALERVVPPIVVVFDIKPGSCPNPFNVKQQGVTPMAIVGTEDFDVTLVDPESIVLIGPDGGLTPPIKWSYDDSTAPPEGEEPCDCYEGGGDGYLDLVFHFESQDIVGILGAVSDWDVVVLGMEAELFEGPDIVGEDCIRIIKKKGGKKPKALAVFPQPANPEIWIPYELDEAVGVKIAIHDSSGRLIRTLSLGHQEAGAYTTKEKAAYWDGRNEAGEEVSSGIYFCTIRAGDFTAIKKMVIAR
jgi:hypothetical protein